MKTLTHRTDVDGQERHQEKRKPHRQVCHGRMTRGQRGIISGRSFWAGFCYARTSIVRWNRASQVVEGMRWNAYMAHGKATPSSTYHREAMAPIAGGIMKGIKVDREKRAQSKKSYDNQESKMETCRTISLRTAEKRKAQTITDLSQRITDVSQRQENRPPGGECQAETAVPSISIITIEPIAVRGKEQDGKGLKGKELDARTKNPDPMDYVSTPPQEPQPMKSLQESGSPASESTIDAPSIIQSSILQMIIQISAPRNGIPTVKSIPQQSDPQKSTLDSALPTQAILRPDTRKPFAGQPAIELKAPDIKAADIKVDNRITKQSAAFPNLPSFEGLIGMPVERPGITSERPEITSNQGPIQINIARSPGSPGYISTARRKIRSLKTASAAADMPL